MKRFTDTDLWQKPWFMKLAPTEKAAWFFLKDHCDSVGVWTPNYELAEFLIGSHVDWDELKRKCNGNIIDLKNGKWWLPDFCHFQYGQLTPKCKPHVKYISELKKHGLYERVSKGYPKGINTRQEKEQEEDEEQDKYGKKFSEFWESYPRGEKKAKAWESWQKKKCDGLFDTIMGKLELFKLTKEWNDGFVPHAVTWINQKRWEDEVQAQKKPEYFDGHTWDKSEEAA